MSSTRDFRTLGTPRSQDAGSDAIVTRLLNEASEGDAYAATSLLPLVYDQLRAFH